LRSDCISININIINSISIVIYRLVSFINIIIISITIINTVTTTTVVVVVVIVVVVVVVVVTTAVHRQHHTHGITSSTTCYTLTRQHTLSLM
jgi:hypothetical protein